MTHSFQALSGFVLVFLVACRSEPVPSTGQDTRTPVTLPTEAAEAVRAEMRTMLTSLHEIHLGLAARDTSLVRRGAIASGLAAAADPALEPLLPAEFLRLGVATHSQFDSLALALSADAPVDSLLARLPRLTANCITCHAAYRLGPTSGQAVGRARP